MRNTGNGRSARPTRCRSSRSTRGASYIDDRDGWANGTFAGYWAREVLPLPGIAPRHWEILRKTADAISERDRTLRRLLRRELGWPGGPGLALVERRPPTNPPAPRRS